MRRLYIFDTTLRDGEKTLGITLNVNEKLEISRQLVKLGVDIIEVGFPASSAGDLDSVRTIAQEVKGAIICGFSRAVEQDIDCCAQALRKAEQPRIHTGIVVSPVQMEKKLQLSPEQVIETAAAVVKHARKYVEDVEFYAEDAFRSHPPFLAKILEKVIEAGATVVNIPDTAGCATPWEYSELITYIMNNVKNIERAVVSIHCHNDLGMATANSLAGIKAGAGQVQCTVNGIGERAGNTSLEEVIMAIYTQRDQYGVEVRVNTREISATSRLVSKVTGVPVPEHKAIVGANAFVHAPGIHQDSVLKEKAAYEIIDPDIIGMPRSQVVLNGEENKNIIVKNISVTTTGVSRATATVTLDLEGNTVTDAACGNGPVDAVFKAVERLVGERVCLEDYTLKSVSRGREALGDATVKVRYGDNRLVVGKGISTNVIEASAKAYVNALAKVKTIIRENAGLSP